ncbi:hypothetical protein [Cellulosimicrobium composti]|uniref:Integral membrane protein n=1 Tax=Cellulosimicrobium composti TaxID=2672572 RepID=A0A6N7ZHT4_9MICO|nr:hypothetical protein [Cellulosimicrobium composti]MTG89007.1 hypothetical protein [Cellulosimicrobium composti]
MTAAVLALVALAGLSEAAGRVLPVVARRSRASGPLVAALMLTGTVVEAVVIVAWPAAAVAVARATGAAPGVTLGWTAATVAPLVLAAVLALPLVGPFLHATLLVAVGAAMAGRLADAAGAGWWAAAACVAVAGLGLAAAVEVVRFVVARVVATGSRRAVA